MLFSENQAGKDQLATDLHAVRDKLATNWCKGSFSNSAGDVCIVAACEEVTGQKQSFFEPDPEQHDQLRLGRMIYYIGKELLNPNEFNNPNFSIIEAQTKIALFNDGPATHDAVLLLVDRTIASVAALVPTK